MSVRRREREEVRPTAARHAHVRAESALPAEIPRDKGYLHQVGRPSCAYTSLMILALIHCALRFEEDSALSDFSRDM